MLFLALAATASIDTRLAYSHEFDDEFGGAGNQGMESGGDARKQYFVIGPRQDQPAPEGGWKLVLILPGGDGSAELNPFCRRIHRQASEIVRLNAPDLLR